MATLIAVDRIPKSGNSGLHSFTVQDPMNNRAMVPMVACVLMAGIYYRNMSAPAGVGADYYAEMRRTPRPGCHQRFKMHEFAEKQKKKNSTE